MLNPDESGFQNNPIIRLNATLPFNFKEGACATGNDQNGNDFALLCFDREAPRTCYICSDLENGECVPIDSFPTRDTTRNAINPYLRDFGNVMERHLWTKNPQTHFWF